MKTSRDLARKLMGGYYSLKDLHIKEADIRALKDQGMRVHSHIQDGVRVYYILTQSENVNIYISGASDKPVTFRWLEVSDIHAGSKQFDEAGFRQILERAVAEGITEVHMAGDLCDGLHIYRGHMNNLRYWTMEDQAMYLASILKDYPLRYIACSGNHDYSWEIQGSPNPILMIESEVPNFTYLQGFVADLIIGGAVCRIMHGASGRSYARSYPLQTYVRDLLDSQGEHVFVKGRKYRLRFIHAGHWHSFMTMESAGIQLSTSGNFQFPNEYTVRRGLVGPQGGRFVTAVMQGGRVIEYASNFVKPNR